MSNNPSISIVICTWNRAASLRTTLQSLNEQSDCDDLDIEVIVVDNNSNDDTKSTIEKILPSWKLGDLRYAFEPRQGKQFALNRGIELSRYEVLAFTDDDIIVPNNWVNNIAHIFEEETLELVGGNTVVVWPDCGKPSWFDTSMSAIVGAVDLGNNRLCPPPAGYTPAGANLVARRTLFKRIGMFSETHFRHMDHEFGSRCARAQVNIAYEPTLLVCAPVDNACLSKRYFRRWSFKAGIASDDESHNSSVATFLFAPRWLYRQLIEDLVFLLSRFLQTDDALVFSRELRLWRTLGAISSRWYAKWRPEHYSKWVKKYSQKKKNLY